MKLLQTGPDRYSAPPKDYLPTVNPRTLAFFVGVVALGLPTVLLVASLFPVSELRTCFRNSISNYYYAQFWGGPFIGALIFIGTYMLAYRGQHPAESRLSSIAGFFAIGVALFPVSGHGCDAASFRARALTNFGPDSDGGPLDLLKHPAVDNLPDITAYFRLTSYSDIIHYTSAGMLFIVLAWFAFFVFSAVQPHQRQPDGSLMPNKRRRNIIYHSCGAVMVAAILVMAFNAITVWRTGAPLSGWNTYNLTFWCEAVALWAFGLSWAVKSRFWGTALRDQEDARPLAP